MRRYFLLIGMFISLLFELIVLFFFGFSETTKWQDTVAVNEAVHTVQNDWDSLAQHQNRTALDYVVLDTNGNVLYRTKTGLSESLNMAIHHKDTILDLEIDGRFAGKLIVYNRDEYIFAFEKQTVIFVITSAMLLQCLICILYFSHIQCTVIRPFRKLKKFAERIADGNLDIPLEMDRQNLFGAFTESFDLMRSELRKAKIAEAKANESKKELVAKLSHDIKTPVASIKAASEVGVALAPDEKTKENYRQISQKTDQINTLVTNLFSAALEELQELAITPMDMKSAELRELLEGADYLHRANIPGIPDCLLFADRLRLQQVFDNIFANSYKYADTNIVVAIGVSNSFLAVSIEDFGGGVEGAELPLLKEKFKRGSNADKIEGAGLGLYISDFCMKKMKGSLDIENSASGGLLVTVRIALSDRI